MAIRSVCNKKCCLFTLAIIRVLVAFGIAIFETSLSLKKITVSSANSDVDFCNIQFLSFLGRLLSNMVKKKLLNLHSR